MALGKCHQSARGQLAQCIKEGLGSVEITHSIHGCCSIDSADGAALAKVKALQPAILARAANEAVSGRHATRIHSWRPGLQRSHEQPICQAQPVGSNGDLSRAQSRALFQSGLK